MTVIQRTIHRLLILILFTSPAMAQAVSFGGKAGTTVTDQFTLSTPESSFTNYSTTPRRYTFGPTFELELPYHFAFEFDALYKRLSYVSYPFGFTSFRATTTANSWEFPLLVKRRFLTGIGRPYGDAGVSFRNIGGSTTFSNTTFQATQDPLELIHPWSTGFAAGGGVDFSYGAIHVSPEVRYTRWSRQNFSSSNGVLGSNLNAFDILIGVTFTNEHQ
jgi:opacity protein-like surface antigen